MKSNCIFQAVKEFWKMHKEWVAEGMPDGGEPYFWVRSSRLAPRWIPHAGIAQRKNGRFIIKSFKPEDTSPLKWWQIWRVFIFVGRWVEGD